MNSSIFSDAEKKLHQQGFKIVDSDFERPWGGFLVIDETQAQQFANIYFDGMDINILKISEKLSPKILIVNPQKRLSWQYHERRAEIWKMIEGDAFVVRSTDDNERKPELFEKNSIVKLTQGERHRLIGGKTSAIIAEIWQHTNNNYSSDENDIIRLQDDYGR